ncbi:uncharacterized protein (TIGR00369 family) [Scopulibacillus darangshiensis]|uniref:Uncharacterized protein (TIGR00369 family) n=1 Tax=Scopulibacillus darangshiensis TaxID=442528 RepID=A0A4R2P8W2_9BACL|nr:PaaI family thioesterase [Scopulibacillus darangshiensis]TCP30491.1 uncharacterized protein (TIGR00369 family) [Scopulibacillus darangshiensis]
MRADEKSAVNDLLKKVLEEANREELDVLEQLLNGIRAKQTKQSRTYINGVLEYKGGLTGEGTYEAEIKLNPFIMNPLNIVHGGMTATFADTAMGTLVNDILGQDMTSVTSEIKVNYLKPAAGDTLKCKAIVVHKGKNLCFVTADILSDRGKLVAHASGSFFIVPVPKGLTKNSSM